MGNDNNEGDAESSNGYESPTDVGIPEQRTAETSSDTILRLLSNERRRRLISFLLERQDERVPVDDVIDYLTREERPDPGPVVHRERVAIDLHHAHIPILADAGVIEHDPVAETVRYEGPDVLATLLAATYEYERQEE